MARHPLGLCGMGINGAIVIGYAVVALLSDEHMSFVCYELSV
jgi:hypothetical protein